MSRPELAKSEVLKDLPIACVAEPEAVEFFEAKRWGDTPYCPHCASVNVYKMTGRGGERNPRFLWRCRDCKKQFTVRIGTVFEESLIPMHKWARALWEASASKNGVSALELSRKIQVTHRTALFMLNRLRHAMASDDPNQPKMTGTVEVDETFIGGRHKKKNLHTPGPAREEKPKTAVMAMVQRGGDVRMEIVPRFQMGTLSEVVKRNIDPSANLLTDAAPYYTAVGRTFLSHKTVRHHAGEYVQKNDPTAHTNTVEGVFSRLKRGIVGTYHNVSVTHLHRYLAQTAWLYNARKMNDGDRIVDLIKRTQGKRLRVTDVVQRRVG